MHHTLQYLPMLAAIMAGPAIGAPSPLTPRQEDWDGTQTGGIFCERRLQPNWNDCTTIMDGNNYFGDENPDLSICVNPRACRIWTEGNCRISFCNNEGHEVCDPAITWGDRARAIENSCKPNDLGGYQSKPPPEEWSEVAIRLATDWRVATGKSAGTSYKEISVEENAAELCAFYDGIEREAAASKTNGLERRQADKFSNVVISYNVYKPGSAVWVGQVKDNGDYTVSTSESVTFSVTTSVSIGATAWEAVSAEIGVSSSYSETMTNTVSVNVNVQCEDGYGQVYWRPFFDEYSGTLESTGQKVTIWVPKNTDASRMNYDYQCTG